MKCAFSFHISAAEFDQAVNAFVLETTTLFPDDNLIALLRKRLAPIINETSGDCIELALEAVKVGGIRQRANAGLGQLRSPCGNFEKSGSRLPLQLILM